MKKNKNDELFEKARQRLSRELDLIQVLRLLRYFNATTNLVHAAKKRDFIIGAVRQLPLETPPKPVSQIKQQDYSVGLNIENDSSMTNFDTKNYHQSNANLLQPSPISSSKENGRNSNFDNSRSVSFQEDIEILNLDNNNSRNTGRIVNIPLNKLIEKPVVVKEADDKGEDLEHSTQKSHGISDLNITDNLERAIPYFSHRKDDKDDGLRPRQR